MTIPPRQMLHNCLIGHVTTSSFAMDQHKLPLLLGWRRQQDGVALQQADPTLPLCEMFRGGRENGHSQGTAAYLPFVAEEMVSA